MTDRPATDGLAERLEHVIEEHALESSWQCAPFVAAEARRWLLDEALTREKVARALFAQAYHGTAWTWDRGLKHGIGLDYFAQADAIRALLEDH